MKPRCLLALHLAPEYHASPSCSFTNRKGDGGKFGSIYLIGGAGRSALSISRVGRSRPPSVYKGCRTAKIKYGLELIDRHGNVYLLHGSSQG